MYPLKFNDIFKSVIWGGDKIGRFKGITLTQESVGESWEISDVKGNVSVVKNGADAGLSLDDLIRRDGAQLLGQHVEQRFGTTFPLLIKFIDARDNLSIQVHPDDTLAQARHNSRGKTEMWYVIDAEPGAGLYSGFSRQITPDEYVRRVADDTITDVLAFHPVKKGDVFFLPAGRIHAIGKGIFIAEIQQTSDITYRIYDYNRKGADGKPRQLHTDLAKDAIDYKLYDDLKTTYTPALNQAVELVSCPYFTTSVLRIENSVTRPVAAHDSFSVYICMEGAATLTDSNGNTLELHRGETCLIPAATTEVTLTPHDSALLLESYIA